MSLFPLLHRDRQGLLASEISVSAGRRKSVQARGNLWGANNSCQAAHYNSDMPLRLQRFDAGVIWGSASCAKIFRHFSSDVSGGSLFPDGSVAFPGIPS